MHVLKRSPDGLYVAKPGRAKSYTNKIAHAQKFPTSESAEADRCPENEYIVSVDAEIGL